MKPNLVKAAAEVIPDPKILINVVSRRVKQLCLGHRAMVQFVPGLGILDVALSEIAAGKLTVELIPDENGKAGVPHVVDFPAAIDKKPNKKAA